MSLSQRRARSGRAGTTRRRGKGPGALGMLKRGASMLGRGRARAGVRRRRGITATELRGFNKVSGMLGRWGMAPRKMRGARLKAKRR